jgi:hypothetical protein
VSLGKGLLLKHFFVSKYEDKKLKKDTAISGVASLQNSFGKTGGFSRQ